MRRLRGWLIRLAGVFRTGRTDRELDAEIESNLRLQIDDNLRAGMVPEDARRAALLKFGGIEATKERYRDRKSVPFFEHLIQDVRSSLRVFRRSPWFFGGLILTLALGVGANGAVFSILQAVLLQPLPYERPDEVVMVWRAPEHPVPPGPQQINADPTWRRSVSSDLIFGWREGLRKALSDYAALFTWQDNKDYHDLPLKDGARRLRGATVTPNFFEVLACTRPRGAYSRRLTKPAARRSSF
jgi:hypothetical protein